MIVPSSVKYENKYGVVVPEVKANKSPTGVPEGSCKTHASSNAGDMGSVGYCGILGDPPPVVPKTRKEDTSLQPQ